MTLIFVLKNSKQFVALIYCVLMDSPMSVMWMASVLWKTLWNTMMIVLRYWG